MPYPKKPIALIKLEGNPGKRRIPKGIDLPPSDPGPPSHLDDYGKEEWARISIGLEAMGVLTEVDRAALAAYCDAYAVWRTACEQIAERVRKGGKLAGLIDVTKTGHVIQNALVGVRNKAREDMVRFSTEFGMTPQARARLAVDPGKGKKSKFEGLVGLVGGKK
jgi:P27 family predicted phage terminase small subunit